MSYMSQFMILHYAEHKLSYKNAVKEFMIKHKNNLSHCVSYAGVFHMEGLTENELDELYKLYKEYENANKSE